MDCRCRLLCGDGIGFSWTAVDNDMCWILYARYATDLFKTNTDRLKTGAHGLFPEGLFVESAMRDRSTSAVSRACDSTQQNGWIFLHLNFFKIFFKNLLTKQFECDIISLVPMRTQFAGVAQWQSS